MPRKHHARLPEIVAEVAVDAGVVLQLVGLNELEQVYKKSMQIVISRAGAGTRRNLKIQTSLIKIS